MNELDYLRKLEQDIQTLRWHLPQDPTTAQNLATSMKVSLNNRIIELLDVRIEERRNDERK